MEKIWDEIKTEIKKQIPGHSYRMWIDPLKFQTCEDDRVVITCPNFFSRKRVQDHYTPQIEALILQATGKKCKLALEISEKKVTKAKADLPVNRQMGLPNINVYTAGNRLLRKNFTFDRFVVGLNNDFAYSASLSLASRKGLHQNSLFLLSRTGMGKSHLSQAIGHHVMAQHPTDSVYYVTAEDFTNEMIHAIRNDSMNSFKEKYRTNCDVLILEDIHFLTGKDRTQVELALSLDYLFDSDKKIIFTSCYLPADIPKMNEQLKSRLSCGLIPSIDPPDFETRVRILRKKAKDFGYVIPGEITEFLAGELTENIRQLESGLIGVTAKSSLLGTPIDLDLAQSVVSNIANTKKTVTIQAIKKLVCTHYRITEDEITSKSRKQKIVFPRQIAMYLSRRFTDQTLQAIGKSFNRYHATAIRSVGAIEKGMKEDVKVQKQIEFLAGKLKSGNF